MENSRREIEPPHASWRNAQLARYRRRLEIALALSLVFHAFLLLLQLGEPGSGLPGLALPWAERRVQVPDLTVRLAEAPRAAAPAPLVVRPPAPRPEKGFEVRRPVAAVTAPRRERSRPSRQAAEPAPAGEAPAPRPEIAPKPEPEILAQDAPRQDTFSVPAPRPIEPEPPRAPEIAAARPAEDEARQKAEEEARRKAEVETRKEEEARQEEARRLALEEARRKAEEENKRKAEGERRKQDEQKQEEAQRLALEEARRKVEEETRRKAEVEKRKEEDAKRVVLEAEAMKRAEEAARQQAAARQKELEARQRAEEEARQRAEAERRKEQEAKRLAEAAAAQVERERLAARPATPGPGGPAGASPAPGALSGKELAAKVLGQIRTPAAAPADPSRAPSLPGRADLRRRSVFGVERDVVLRWYVESWRAKIERNGPLNYRPSAALRAPDHPVVTVMIRSDGSLEDVHIHRSSGVREIDEATRRIARINAPYSAFPPDMARQFDVIEIRRVWQFDDTLRIMEETR